MSRRIAALSAWRSPPRAACRTTCVARWLGWACALTVALHLVPGLSQAGDNTADADFLDFIEYLGSWEDDEGEQEWMELIDRMPAEVAVEDDRPCEDSEEDDVT